MHREAASPGPSMSLGGMSLRGVMQRAREQAQPTQAAPRRSSAFTADALTEAWHRLPGRLPGVSILASIIESVEPVLTPGTTDFVLTAMSTVQADQLNTHRSQILANLAEMLDNDSLNFSVVVDDTNLAPAYWDQKRVLDFILQAHPDLKDTMAKYHIRLL